MLNPFLYNNSYFSICSLMNDVYVIGGRRDCFDLCSEKSCYKFEVKSNKWTKVADLQKDRSRSACTVFEGKIVVTGGFNERKLKSVELYDHHVNTWKFLSDMIKARCNHSAVSISNKVFMIGGNSDHSEVFDSVTRKSQLFYFVKVYSFSTYYL